MKKIILTQQFSTSMLADNIYTANLSLVRTEKDPERVREALNEIISSGALETVCFKYPCYFQGMKYYTDQEIKNTTERLRVQYGSRVVSLVLNSPNGDSGRDMSDWEEGRCSLILREFEVLPLTE